MALPPYFPVDRNEAFIPAGTPDQPATALSKYLGLAWRLRRGESLGFLAKVMPVLTAPELAAGRRRHPPPDGRPARRPASLADLASGARNPVRKRQLLTTLAAKLAGQWNAERNDPRVAAAIKEALEKPELRAEGIELAAATRDARYEGTLEAFAQDPALARAVRVAAVEAIGTIGAPSGQTLLDRLIDGTKGKPNPTRSLRPRFERCPGGHDAANRLSELIDARDLSARRAPRGAPDAGPRGGRSAADPRHGEGRQAARRSEDRGDHAPAHHLHPRRRLRDEAARVLPLPKTASGRPLPPFGELMRREGDPEQGRAVFFRTGLNSCASCHRVRGQGQWVGPDLSTIGTKYGKDELLRSILNPSAAIGYNYRALIAGPCRRPRRHRAARRGHARPAGDQDGRRPAGGRPAGRHRRPQDQRRLAHARRAGPDDDRYRAGGPAGVSDARSASR